MALGSLTELQNQLLIARDTGNISTNTFDDLSEQTIVVRQIIKWVN